MQIRQLALIGLASLSLAGVAHAGDGSEDSQAFLATVTSTLTRDEVRAELRAAQARGEVGRTEPAPIFEQLMSARATTEVRSEGRIAAAMRLRPEGGA